MDLNALLSAALQSAVEQATAPLLQRIAALEAGVTTLEEGVSHRVLVQQANIVAALAERIDLLEATDPSDRVSGPALEAAPDWLLEQVQKYAVAAAESAVQDHLAEFDHDEYDSAIQQLGSADLDDFVTSDSLTEAVKEVLDEARVSFNFR